MFDSLVESGSHSDDIARKGSFFLGTMLLYVVGLLAAAVGGIYYANSSIPDPSLELLTLVAPVPVAQQQEQKVEQKQEQKPAASKEPQVNTRVEISVVAPVVKSNEVAKETTKEISRAKSAVTIQGTSDRDAPPGAAVPSAIGSSIGGGGVSSGGPPPPVVAVADDAPPPPPKPTPTPAPKPKTIVSGGVLNGKAISKPQPPYPAIAKAARASGTVTVQIVVDESGRVISASAVSGHPLLQQAAVAAARQARFSPTLLSGQPVKVSGVITYNFVLQ
jgi:periplasmic protein TonB